MRILAVGTCLLLMSCSREAAQPEQPRGGETATATTAPPKNSNRGDLAPPGDLSQQFAAKRSTLVAEAAAALQETYAAVDLLAKSDSPGAVEALTRATGKLDVVLAADPQLALAPVDVKVAIHDVIATPNEVESLRKRAEAALDDGRLQDARHLIAGLASESVISVTSLPLATYPAAIKRAAALIHDGMAVEAQAMIEAALSTLVVENTIVPLPLARAEALLARAQPTAEKPQRTAEERSQLQSLLADARRQLDLARALGYATKNDLGALYDALKAIESSAERDEAGKGLFGRLKDLFGTANRNSNTGLGGG